MNAITFPCMIRRSRRALAAAALAAGLIAANAIPAAIPRSALHPIARNFA